MAYCIFQKSLRNVEEFRKNPHIQIPSKSPCKICQILRKSQFISNSKIKISFESSIGIRPSPPTLTHLPRRPLPPSRSPLGSWHCGAFTKRCLLFRFVHSSSSTFSLFLSLTCGPHLSALSSSLLHPCPATPSSSPAAPSHVCCPARHQEMPPSRLNSPPSSKPHLNPS
jgi:hypothetical protein